MHHPLGLIHGRFQVLHNDHMVYLMAGKALCDHLIVGITNPTTALTVKEDANPSRSNPENNPLTYEERETMVRAAFLEAGLSEDTFSIMPFPISRPDLLAEQAPRDAVYYLTIYDEWGHEKESRLRSLGLETHVMWERPEEEKGIAATEVRLAIKDGGEWDTMVPPSVAELVREWNLQERLGGSSRS